jgi:chromosome segregation ATPase
MYLVCESKKQNEFQQILNKYKNENLDLSEKNKTLTRDLESKTNELNLIKKSTKDNNDQLSFYQNNCNDLLKKLEGLESEKNYLMKIIDEKNEEIENLMNLEVENAELKAKTLLENLDSNSGSTSDLNFAKKISEKNAWNNNLSGGDSNSSEKNIKIGI